MTESRVLLADHDADPDADSSVVPKTAAESRTKFKGLEDYEYELNPDHELTPEEHLERTKAAVGHHFRAPDYYEVGREKIREYANAVLDRNPYHYDEAVVRGLGYTGLIAPPTFGVVAGMLATSKLFENVVTGYDLSQVMQTDQRIEYFEPVVAGDRLTCDVYFESFRQAPGGADIIVTKNEVFNQRDELVMRMFTTLASRSGGGTMDAETLATVKGVMLSDRT